MHKHTHTCHIGSGYEVAAPEPEAVGRRSKHYICIVPGTAVQMSITKALTAPLTARLQLPVALIVACVLRPLIDATSHQSPATS